MSDPAEDVIAHLIGVLRQVFDPKATTPPRGGGTTMIRMFAGDSIPLSAWDAHSETCTCSEPFVWVRVTQRYRTTSNAFPKPIQTAGNCGSKRALEIEAGIGRCAYLAEEIDFKEYEREAMISLDDSRRLDAALCRAMQCAVSDDDAVRTAVGPVVPWGPQGGVIANIGTAWVQLP